MSETESMAWDGRWFDDQKLVVRSTPPYRVRLSALGGTVVSRHRYVVGTVLHESGNGLRILWDGRRGLQTWSAEYVERIPRNHETATP